MTQPCGQADPSETQRVSVLERQCHNIIREANSEIAGRPRLAARRNASVLTRCRLAALQEKLSSALWQSLSFPHER